MEHMTGRGHEPSLENLAAYLLRLGSEGVLKIFSHRMIDSLTDSVNHKGIF